MGLEIERKFLLQGDAWRREVTRTVEMRQGYLSAEGGKASVRVRVEPDGARLNIKAAVVGASRAEYDVPMSRADALEILETLCAGRLEKRRHFIERDGLVWEIDEFLRDNAGLIVAEIELQSEQQAFVRPEWLGREVTDDRRYYNHHLALHPYRTWADR
jgi:adenylate cyclase